MKSDESLYHTTAVNQDGLPGRAYIVGNDELNVQVSSPRKPDEPGANPEQFMGLAFATCLNSTIQAIEEGRGLQHNAEVRVGVDLKYDDHGLRFVIDAKVVMPGIDREQAQEIVEFAEKRCPVSKLISDKPDVSVELVDSF